jgi:hypothetical protein
MSEQPKVQSLVEYAQSVFHDADSGAGYAVVNLTPHPIKVFREPNPAYDDPAEPGVFEIPRSGWIARLSERDGEPAKTWALPAPFIERQLGEVFVVGADGAEAPFPPPVGWEAGVESRIAWIVALPVAQRLQRPDVFAPDTGRGAVRDDKGQIVGVRGFVRIVLP